MKSVPPKILILCRANSCRSQMAAAFLERIDPALFVRSAGTDPIEHVHPLTIKVLKELEIDISHRKPVDISVYLHESWDFLITVCDVAKEECPAFHGDVKQRIYYRFVDPLDFSDKEPKLHHLFREVRDNIETEMKDFYEDFIQRSNE
jgi:arsenate reductase